MVGVTTKGGKNIVGSLLKEMGVRYIPARRAYKIPEFDLERPETLKMVTADTTQDVIEA